MAGYLQTSFKLVVVIVVVIVVVVAVVVVIVAVVDVVVVGFCAFPAGKGKEGKGKGKGKGKDSDKGKRGAKRSRDDTSLSSFASSSSSAPPAKHARITSNTCPVLTSEHNPARPYRYCWFHGWIFSHSINECKRILKSNDQARLNATAPTSTTPPGNAYVEPAYKSWWI